MSTIAAPDLRTSYPRSGREMLGQYSWLARLADKVRAEHAGTAGEYIAYCGLSMGFLERAGVSKDEFDALITKGANDVELETYFDEHVDVPHRDAANDFVLHDKAANLDEQDKEEGR